MRISTLFALLVPFMLAGCIGFTDATPAPQRTTVVVPASPAPTVVCSTGAAPPC